MNELRVEKLRNDPQSVPKGTFGYDATGNRTAATWLGATSSLTYPSTSHRLSAFAGESRTYDAMGNPLTVGARQLRYDDRAKLDQVTLPGSDVWQYGYTGQGLRVTKRKADDASTLRHFVYDESAQLIGEYDQAGAPLREVIWLGNLPIGVIDGASATPVLHYVESDHLGTPRVVVDATRNVSIWRWNQTDDPFGRSAPNSNPDGDATSFAFNLRFAGQYHDAETGWHYNVHRYYDPSIGRYLESDPIGLGGGITTYGYVGSAPLSAVDPFGLWSMDPIWGAVHTATGGWDGSVDPLFGLIHDATGGWSPEQSTVDFWAGMGDGASFGLTNWIRDRNGSNGAVDKCSGSYLGGSATALFMTPLGRLGYMAQAARIPMLATSARQAVQMRNSLRLAYRGPLTRIPFFRRWHIRTYEELASAKSDAAIIMGAGNLNRRWTLGMLTAPPALGVASAARDFSGCSCP
jgi:RHS repeat-associated protein